MTMGTKTAATTMVWTPSVQSGHRRSDRVIDRWVPHGLLFSNYPKLVEICKFKMDALHCSKNSEILHKAGLRCYERLSNCTDLKFPTELMLKILEPIQYLNFLLILKGFKPSRKNLINSPNFPLHFFFTKGNLVRYTCM
jgi:hypothetical protein